MEPRTACHALLPDSLLSPLAGELVLHVRSGPAAGRTWRSSLSKCTVGSAAQCTFRVTEPDVRPVQCVILRGRAGMVARCWSGDTRLNGLPFRDASLAPGDRLQIGDTELEIGADSPGAESPERATPSEPSVPSATVLLEQVLQRMELLQTTLAEQIACAAGRETEAFREMHDGLAARLAQLEQRLLVAALPGASSSPRTPTPLMPELPSPSPPAAAAGIVLPPGDEPGAAPDYSSAEATWPEPTHPLEPRQNRSHDDSIREYMERLLQRVNSGSPLPATPGSPAWPFADATPASESPAADGRSLPELLPDSGYDSAVRAPMATPVAAGEPASNELQPRSQAPERGATFAAMRQLSTVATCDAILKSDGSRARGMAVGKIMVGTVGLAGGLLLVSWAIMLQRPAFGMTACVCLLVALLACAHIARLWSDFQAAKRSMPRWDLEPDPEDRPDAADSESGATGAVD